MSCGIVITTNCHDNNKTRSFITSLEKSKNGRNSLQPQSQRETEIHTRKYGFCANHRCCSRHGKVDKKWRTWQSVSHANWQRHILPSRSRAPTTKRGTSPHEGVKASRKNNVRLLLVHLFISSFVFFFRRVQCTSQLKWSEVKSSQDFRQLEF